MVQLLFLNSGLWQRTRASLCPDDWGFSRVELVKAEVWLLSSVPFSSYLKGFCFQPCIEVSVNNNGGKTSKFLVIINLFKAGVTFCLLAKSSPEKVCEEHSSRADQSKAKGRCLWHWKRRHMWGHFMDPLFMGSKLTPKVGRRTSPKEIWLKSLVAFLYSFPALSADRYLLHSPFSLSAQIMPEHLHTCVPTEVDHKVWTQIILFTIF